MVPVTSGSIDEPRPAIVGTANGIISCAEIRIRKMNSLASILWTVVVILFVFWLVGFLLHFGGSLIHLILIVIGIIVVINLLTGRGARV